MMEEETRFEDQTSLARETGFEVEVRRGEPVAWENQSPSLEEMYDTAYDFLCDDETDKAIAAYKAILAIDPNYVEAVHDLAHAYSDNEQLDEAIEMAKKLTELSPGDEMSFTVLSRLYQQKGMVVSARPGARARPRRVRDGSAFGPRVYRRRPRRLPDRRESGRPAGL